MNRPCLILMLLLAYVAGAIVLPAGHVHFHGETCHQHAVPSLAGEHGHSHPHCSHTHHAESPAESQVPAGVPASEDECPLCELLSTPAQIVHSVQIQELPQTASFLVSGQAIAATLGDFRLLPLRGPPSIV